MILGCGLPGQDSGNPQDALTVFHSLSLSPRGELQQGVLSSQKARSKSATHCAAAAVASDELKARSARVTAAGVHHLLLDGDWLPHLRARTCAGRGAGETACSAASSSAAACRAKAAARRAMLSLGFMQQVYSEHRLPGHRLLRSCTARGTTTTWGSPS